MVKYGTVMGKVRRASWVIVHVNVRCDRSGKGKIRYDDKKRKKIRKERKENRTQQRVRNNTPSLRGEPLDRPRCFDGVRSWNVVFE